MGNGGSPPRVRGKVEGYARDRLGHRITPACAGKSNILFVGHGVFWDHPRVCGEKPKIFGKTIEILGSPPRVRGKD